MTNTERIKLNARDLELEFFWLDRVLKGRSAINSGSGEIKRIEEVEAPKLSRSSDYGLFVEKHELDFDERLILMLALAPHLKPKALDIFLHAKGTSSGFGGRQGKNHKGFLPTGETVLFVLAGSDLEKRIKLHQIFGTEHVFSIKQVLWLSGRDAMEPLLSGMLTVSQDYLDLFTTGKVQKPVFSHEFPARQLTTNMDWDDLILPPATRQGLESIEHWIALKERIAADSTLGKRIKPGYKTLFYGPPGTGKSISAAIIGRKTGRDVFRIDLSQMVSKFIGETEKNLARVFDRAENKDWILFFDEADALFGKRTDTKESNDRFANQEVSYLLQRIEEHNGLTILASNFKENIDPAFSRRLKTIIQFPMPDKMQREKIWSSFLSGDFKPAADVDLRKIAQNYEMAGGSIINVVEYCLTQALRLDKQEISEQDILQGIKLEFSKVGRIL